MTSDTAHQRARQFAGIALAISCAVSFLFPAAASGQQPPTMFRLKVINNQINMHVHVEFMSQQDYTSPDGSTHTLGIHNTRDLPVDVNRVVSFGQVYHGSLEPALGSNPPPPGIPQDAEPTSTALTPSLWQVEQMPDGEWRRTNYFVIPGVSYIETSVIPGTTVPVQTVVLELDENLETITDSTGAAPGLWHCPCGPIVGTTPFGEDYYSYTATIYEDPSWIFPQSWFKSIVTGGIDPEGCLQAGITDCGCSGDPYDGGGDDPYDGGGDPYGDGDDPYGGN